MDVRQKHGFRTLRGARDFLDEHPDIAASVNASDSRKALDDAIARLTAENVTQDQSRNQLQGETAQIKALRKQLRLDHMRPIANVAKANFTTEPFFKALKLPGSQVDNDTLLNAAREMSANAAPQSATFTAAGLPADFIAQLDAATTALAKAVDGRTSAKARRVGATQNIASILREGRHAVKVINSLIEPALKADDGLLATWNNAIRVGGGSADSAPAAPAGPGHPAAPATPATPATPVPPAVPVAPATPAATPATGSAAPATPPHTA